MDMLPKKTYKWPTATWKGTQITNHQENAKPQWYITSHVLEWLSLERH